MKKIDGVVLGKALWFLIGLAFFTAVIAGVEKEAREAQAGE